MQTNFVQSDLEWWDKNNEVQYTITGEAVEVITKADFLSYCSQLRQQLTQPNTAEKVQKIGDGRLVYNGETYVNENSGRVLTAEQFLQQQLPK